MLTPPHPAVPPPLCLPCTSTACTFLAASIMPQTFSASSPPTATTTTCACCGAPNAPKLCSQCRAASYCTASCQRKHWRAGHKKNCRRGAAPGGAATSSSRRSSSSSTDAKLTEIQAVQAELREAMRSLQSATESVRDARIGAEQTRTDLDNAEAAKDQVGRCSRRCYCCGVACRGVWRARVLRTLPRSRCCPLLRCPVFFRFWV